MKRILITGLLTIMIVTATHAQFRLGLRGGMNTAYFKATELVTDDYRFTTLNDATVGFHGGMMMQINFFGMFLQPELLLSSLNSDVRISELGQSTVTHIREQSFTKLDFPVMIGKRIGAARIGIGPVGTIMLSTKSELNEFGLEEQFNSATFGYQAGVGIDILQRIALDLKYEGNLSKLGDGITIGGEQREFDSRSRQFIVSIGVFF